MHVDGYNITIIVKIGFEFFPLGLGVCCALLYLNPRCQEWLTGLIQTSIATGIFWALNAGELVGPWRIALEAAIFDCGAVLIGSISVWLIFQRVHHLKGG
jgi:membrane protein CcdC involved in cytochrome C biogenesis